MLVGESFSAVDAAPELKPVIHTVDIPGVRADLTTLSKPDREAFEHIMRVQLPETPAITQEHRIDMQEIIRNPSLEWLGKSALDNQLLVFYQWNSYRIQRLQTQPEIINAVSEQMSKHRDGALEGAKSGYFSVPETSQTLDIIQDAGLFIEDYFSTHAIGYNAYAQRENNTAHIAEGRAGSLTSTLENINLYTIHELYHLFGNLDAVWLDEAVTEHVALAAKDHQWESPLVHDGDLFMYIGCRNLLDAIQTQAVHYQGKPIPTECSTWSYGVRNQAMLAKVVDEAYWWVDVLGIVTERVNRLTAEFTAKYAEEKPVVSHLLALDEAADQVAAEWRVRELREAILLRDEALLTSV
jgi:hypothetical protein